MEGGAAELSHFVMFCLVLGKAAERLKIKNFRRIMVKTVLLLHRKVRVFEVLQVSNREDLL